MKRLFAELIAYRYDQDRFLVRWCLDRKAPSQHRIIESEGIQARKYSAQQLLVGVANDQAVKDRVIPRIHQRLVYSIAFMILQRW